MKYQGGGIYGISELSQLNTISTRDTRQALVSSVINQCGEPVPPQAQHPCPYELWWLHLFLTFWRESM